MRTLAVTVAVLTFIASALHMLQWQLLLTLLIGMNANEVHKWSHCSTSENGLIITALQRLGLVQTPAHHSWHHKGRRDTHYCVITNYLNPLLDAINFWRAIESILLSVAGVRKRLDPTTDNELPQTALITYRSIPTRFNFGLRPNLISVIQKSASKPQNPNLNRLHR
jgi:hypothetical protein